MWLPLWDGWLIFDNSVTALNVRYLRCTFPSCCRLWDVTYSLDVMSKTKSKVDSVYSVGGGWEKHGIGSRWRWGGGRKTVFLLCFLAAFTLADSTAWVRLGLVESLLLICSPVNHTSCTGWLGGSVRSHRSVQASSACSTCTDAAYICSTCSQVAYVACALNWCSTCQCDRTAGSVPAI